MKLRRSIVNLLFDVRAFARTLRLLVEGPGLSRSAISRSRWDLATGIVLRSADDRLRQDGLVGKKKRAELLDRVERRDDVGACQL
jgi:hypothetical protein